MKKILGFGLLALAVAIGIFLWHLSQTHHSGAFKFDTTYQAVLLDNGFIYYGKIAQPNPEFIQMTDVYYIQNQVDNQTKQTRSVLVRRGGELHAPNMTFVNLRHVVMIEPVTAGSKLAESIATLTKR